MKAITDQGIAIKTTDCCVCGCLIGMIESLYSERLNDHQMFYCPNGHRQHFTAKTEAEELREKLRDERVRVMELEERSAVLEARRRAAKGQLTKLKKRIDSGICPYCSRHFENVQRHISCKHKNEPEQTEE